jgi:AraC family transcriptional regulator
LDWHSFRRSVRSDEAHGDIYGTTTLIIPEGLYAVFTTPSVSHFDFVATIHRTWEYINMVWLPESGYRRTGRFEFESYVEESRTYSERIFIPLIT